MSRTDSLPHARADALQVGCQRTRSRRIGNPYLGRFGQVAGDSDPDARDHNVHDSGGRDRFG